jgi:hypothetical protein
MRHQVTGTRGGSGPRRGSLGLVADDLGDQLGMGLDELPGNLFGLLVGKLTALALLLSRLGKLLLFGVAELAGLTLPLLALGLGLALRSLARLRLLGLLARLG